MSINTSVAATAIACALAHAPTADAQAVAWRAVAGQSGSVATANLPAGVDRGALLRIASARPLDCAELR